MISSRFTQWQRPGRLRRSLHAGRGVRSFILVEILVAVVVLGIAMAAVLQSFTSGLRSVSADRRLTRGIFLAQGLLEDFEVEAPEDEATVEGDFGDDFPNFFYNASFEDVDIEYHNVDLELGKIEFDPLRKVTVEVFYEAPNGTTDRVVKIESYLTGVEKYAKRAKFYNALY